MTPILREILCDKLYHTNLMLVPEKYILYGEVKYLAEPYPYTMCAADFCKERERNIAKIEYIAVYLDYDAFITDLTPFLMTV